MIKVVHFLLGGVYVWKVQLGRSEESCEVVLLGFFIIIIYDESYGSAKDR